MAGDLAPSEPTTTFHEWDPHTKTLREIDMYSGEVLSERVIDPSASRIKGEHSHMLPFSPVLSEIIYDQLVKGRTLKQITEMPGMPSLVQITRWRAAHEDFDSVFKQARKVRAEVLYDRLTELAEPEGLDKDQLAEKKLQLDTMKWIVEKGDRDTFGARATESGGGGNVIISINTGIERLDPADRGPVVEIESNE